MALLSTVCRGINLLQHAENARSAVDCGSETAALNSEQKAVAARRLTDTALQGAFGTIILNGPNGFFTDLLFK